MITATTHREIQCEYYDGWEEIGEYGHADPQDADSLFSPIFCPNCGEGFMAMGFTPRVHIK